MAQRISRMAQADCLDCYTPLYFEILPPNDQLVICPICESELVVIRRNPLLLGWALEGEFHRRNGELQSWVYTLDDEDYIDLHDAEDFGRDDYLDDDLYESDPDD